MSKSKSIPLERDAVLNYLSAQRFFEIDSAEIITTVRKEGDKYYLVCLNEDRNNAKNGLTLRLCKPFNIEEIRLESGEEYAIAQSVQTLPIRFDAGECRVFRVFEKGMLLPEKTEEVAKKEIELDGEFKYTLNEKNILPLDLAEYSLDGSAFGERLEILQIDRKRAKGCGKAGYLSVKCVSTTSVDGQTVILNGNLEDEGSNRIGLAIALAICLGFTILPLFGFFFLALKGKQAKIESNTIIPNVFVMNEYFIKE